MKIGAVVTQVPQTMVVLETAGLFGICTVGMKLVKS